MSSPSTNRALLADLFEINQRFKSILEHHKIEPDDAIHAVIQVLSSGMPKDTSTRRNVACALDQCAAELHEQCDIATGCPLSQGISKEGRYSLLPEAQDSTSQELRPPPPSTRKPRLQLPENVALLVPEHLSPTTPSPTRTQPDAGSTRASPTRSSTQSPVKPSPILARYGSPMDAGQYFQELGSQVKNDLKKVFPA